MTPAEKLLDFVNGKCPGVAGMKTPLDLTQAEQLLALYPWDDVARQFERIENRPDLLRRYKSAYLTCLKWFEIDIKGGYKPVMRKPLESSVTDRFLAIHPVKSIVNIAGILYRVADREMLESLDDNQFMPIQRAISIIKQKEHENASN